MSDISRKALMIALDEIIGSPYDHEKIILLYYQLRDGAFSSTESEEEVVELRQKLKDYEGCKGIEDYYRVLRKLREAQLENARLTMAISKASDDLNDIIDLEPLKDFVRDELKEVVTSLSPRSEAGGETTQAAPKMVTHEQKIHLAILDAHIRESEKTGFASVSTHGLNVIKQRYESLLAEQSISPHREEVETGVQQDIDKIVDYCSDLNHFDTEEHNSPECFNELNTEDQGEVEEWIIGLMKDSARTAIDMYLDKQGIVLGIKDGRDEV